MTRIIPHWPTYKITRFYQDGDSETIATGLTLDEAQAHCRRDDTRGDGWFDGYDHDDLPASRHHPLSQESA